MIDTKRLAAVFDETPAPALPLLPAWTPYIPHEPFPKQLAFLMMPHREAFFGGAAGGGKSDVLLMGALQYVDVPGYSAIIFRRTFKQLKEPSALIARSMEWLAGTDARWQSQDHRWTFPSGATLSFGYLDSYQDKFNHLSAEYQYIAFDELSQFRDEDYLYLFSRLRRPRCNTHQNEPDESCRICREYSHLRNVPLRVRAASNPPEVGNPGITWVKDRYLIRQDPDGKFRGKHPKRPFLPSYIEDNPAIDRAEYEESLSYLPEVTRKQLMDGDWMAIAKGRFDRKWARYYSRRGPYLVMGRQGKGPTVSLADCRCFITCDPAVSQREGPGDADIWRNRYPSWTVISTWLVTPTSDLIWWWNTRLQVEVPDVRAAIIDEYKKRRHALLDPNNVTLGHLLPEYIGIEWSSLSAALVQQLERDGLPIRRLMHQGHDKLVRATDAQIRMESGKVWFPEDGSANPWKEATEQVIFSWTGHMAEVSDDVDSLAYAALELSSEAIWALTKDDLPSIER